MALILTVDDEHGQRRLLTRLMEGRGHEILEADSADAALQVMAGRPADVVFCDIQMPGRDGLWLAAAIRKAYPITAVVLATAVTTVPPRISMQSGVLAYLVKPFVREKVVEALDAAVQWHEATVTAGPRSDDATALLQEWLDSLR